MAKHVGVAIAILGLLAAAGCSGDSAPAGAGRGQSDGSLSFKLLSSSNVQIDSISYDVKATPGGADIITGSIPVPSDASQHVPVLGLQSLSPGSFSLTLSATGKLPNGSSVPCTSPTAVFSVTSGTNTFIGDLPLTCSITTQVDTSGSATADVSVTTVTTTQGNVVEQFGYGPRSVDGSLVGGACVFPPIAININNGNPAIAYSWAATPDGTFTLNAAKTAGTYNCASNGDKTLTVTGILNGQTSTKSVTVHCNDVPCGFSCGNGIIEGTEQCDDTTPRCVNCQIHPVCGDGITDTGECEPPNTATCDATCHPITVLCGNGTLDPGETCEPPNTATCDSACHTVIPPQDSAVCIPCIRANGANGSTQTAYCDIDPKCLTVEACEIDQKCFDPVPFNCYCGTNDTTACSVPTFVPTGKCVTEIKAGTTATDNLGIITQMQGFDTGAGIATSILNQVFSTAPECHSACF
jgi:hypothetical protein